MAYTLAKLAKLEEQPLRKYVMMNLIRDAKLMELIPWVNVDSLTIQATRWRVLPTVAFRAINASYTADEGDVEQVWESLFILGGETYFDRIFKKVKNTIVDPIKQQSDMKVKAMALTFNNYLINGDPATDPLGFTGLKKRVANLPSRQTVYYAGSGSAAALDVTASVANVTTFFKMLEKQIEYTVGGSDAILTNLNMKLGIGHAARFVNASGGMFLSTTKDSFDRDIPTFRGVPLIDVGLKADQTTEIITDTETADDTGTDATSIYTMKFGEQDGVTGIQLPPGLEVYDPLTGAESPTAPAVMNRFEWVLGLAGFGSYGLTRGHNVEGASNWTA
jgi:hypothetical protein